jgi:predicted phosphodiesterase
MPPSKSPIRLEAEKLVLLMPKASTRSIATRLAKEFKCNYENARSAVRISRGEHIQKHKHTAVTIRPKSERTMSPKMPESLADPWEKFELNETSIACLSDIHIPYHDESALKAAMNYVKKMKPKCVLLNGDACDFYTISRWEKDPRKRDFNKERRLCVEFFEWLRSVVGKKCRIVFKDGNHEERWVKYLWNRAPELSDEPELRLNNWLKFEKFGIEYVTDKRPIMCGKLAVFHGHELPSGLTNPVNMARGAFLRMVDSVLVGHGHRSSNHTEPDWQKREITTWSQGCLCDMNPEYARINKWNHGFATIEVQRGGNFNVTNLRVSPDGKIRTS